MQRQVRMLSVFRVVLPVALWFLLGESAAAWPIEYTVTGELQCQDLESCPATSSELEGARYEAVYRFESGDPPIKVDYWSQVTAADYQAVSADVTVSNRPGGASDLSFSAELVRARTHNAFWPNTSADGLSVWRTTHSQGLLELIIPDAHAHFEQSYFENDEVAALPAFEAEEVIAYYYSVLYARRAGDSSYEHYSLANATFTTTSGPVDPVDAVRDLINLVISADLQSGIEVSLDAKLESAMQTLEDVNANNDVAAINKLEAFIAHVDAQAGHMIPEATADRLIQVAREILEVLRAP